MEKENCLLEIQIESGKNCGGKWDLGHCWLAEDEKLKLGIDQVMFESKTKVLSMIMCMTGE